MACSSLTGDRVRNPAGESLGRLEHVLIDVASGRVAYGVLSFGGVLGLGSKLFAVPWSALTLDVEHQCFLLDIARERLEKAPGFDPERWPSMSDAGWSRTVDQFYDPSAGGQGGRSVQV